jgi:hypothetical protein
MNAKVVFNTMIIARTSFRFLMRSAITPEKRTTGIPMPNHTGTVVAASVDVR